VNEATALQYVTSCTLVDEYQHSMGHNTFVFRVEPGGSRTLRNVGTWLTKYLTSQKTLILIFFAVRKLWI